MKSIRRFGVASVAVLGLLSVTSDAMDGAGGSELRRPASSKAAVEKFWTAYLGNQYEAIPRVEADLQAALKRDPDNATLYALLGAAHFWHFGDSPRDPHPNLPALGKDITTAVSLFRRAVDLDYHGDHPIGYVNDDHLPGYLGITTVHAGRLSGNQALVAEGDKTLEYAVYQFPEFNNFNRWAAHNTDSKDSDGYRKALDSLWQALDACTGTTLDRSNPDLGPYLALQTSVGRKKVCWWNSELAPHSFEGFMLNLGNGLVKAGQIPAAKVIYANAKYADSYASWPYRQALESIASSDLDARAALYADADPRNDPSFGVPGRGCSYCHATAPER